MTRSDVAKRLGKSIATVRRMEGDKLHPSIDKNRVRHFDPAEVERIATGRTPRRFQPKVGGHVLPKPLPQFLQSPAPAEREKADWLEEMKRESREGREELKREEREEREEAKREKREEKAERNRDLERAKSLEHEVRMTHEVTRARLEEEEHFQKKPSDQEPAVQDGEDSEDDELGFDDDGAYYGNDAPSAAAGLGVAALLLAGMFVVGKLLPTDSKR